MLAGRWASARICEIRPRISLIVCECGGLKFGCGGLKSRCRGLRRGCAQGEGGGLKVRARAHNWCCRLSEIGDGARQGPRSTRPGLRHDDATPKSQRAAARTPREDAGRSPAKVSTRARIRTLTLAAGIRARRTARAFAFSRRGCSCAHVDGVRVAQHRTAETLSHRSPPLACVLDGTAATVSSYLSNTRSAREGCLTRSLRARAILAPTAAEVSSRRASSRRETMRRLRSYGRVRISYRTPERVHKRTYRPF